MRSHSQCWAGTEYQHRCHKPSGRTCVVDGCALPAGTWWTRYWCPKHDVERQDRISAQLDELAENLATGQPGDGEQERGRG